MSFRPDRVRYEAYIDRSGGPDACWPWLGKGANGGYGRMRYGGRIWYAHRLTFYLQHDYLPEAVCHRCDNPPCCNPAHLRDGTLSDNAAEMWAKGRQSVAPKLTLAEAQDIRNALAVIGKGFIPALAVVYGVSRRTIYRIIGDNSPKCYQVVTQEVASLAVRLSS